MSTVIQPGDIVQKLGDTSQMIYEVISINEAAEWARLRPMWGSNEFAWPLKRLERMCDEQVTGLSQWRASETYAAMGGVKPSRHDEKVARLAMMYGQAPSGVYNTNTAAPTFKSGDLVKCIDHSGQSGLSLAFLKSKNVHKVKFVSLDGRYVELEGAPTGAYKAARFALVTMHKIINQGTQAPTIVNNSAIAIPVPDMKFDIGTVVEWDTGPHTVVTGTVVEGTWDSMGGQWLYTAAIVAPAKYAGMNASIIEKYLRCAAGEVEAHKHHHHDGHKHKHVMGLDHDEIDHDAYREFMRGL